MMTSPNSQYGFDAAFVEKCPELYRCTVCQLVLRDPILILKCGHRFCTPCMERIKEHSERSQTEVQCPVDRELIDLTMVCEDHGLRRAIGSLHVKCGDWKKGCTWQGELTELEHHVKTCQYRPPSHITTSTREVEDLTSLVKTLQSRLETYEHKFDEKEKETAHLNHRMREMEARCNDNTKEIGILKQKNVEHLTEVALLQKNNEELKKRNTIFEQEIVKLKAKYDGTFRLTDGESSLLKDQIELLTKDVDSLKEKGALCAEDLKKLTNNYEADFNSFESKSSMVNSNITRGEEIQLGNTRVMKGEPEAYQRRDPPKKVVLSQFINAPVIKDNHVEFRSSDGWSTAVACNGGVPLGEKGFYELTFEGGVGSCRVGWVTESYLTSPQRNGIGDCSNSYGYNAKFKCCFHDRKSDGCGGKDESGIGNVIGVAIDNIRGEILYGANGSWEPPMGVAYRNIKKSTQYFPAISGRNVKVFINFGNVAFKFGPPDQSFKKVIDL